MKRILLSTTLLLGITFSGFAQSNFAKLDKYFDALEAHQKFMGTVAVHKDGIPIYSRAVGYKDVGGQKKNEVNTRFRVGSITKTFTSVLILRSVEEGRLDLEQTLDKWYPEVSSAEKIRIRHLLGHRSGIRNFTNTPSYFKWNTIAQTEAELISKIVEGGLEFEPDAKAAYSNSNYVLLSFILEKVYNMPYAQILKEKILVPLQLNDTYVYSEPKVEESKSYTFKEGWTEEKSTHFSVPLGAGAIVSTSSELNRFAEALFEHKLLKEESLELMMGIKEGFGLGLFKMPFYEHQAYGHSGHIDGFSSSLGYFVDDKIAFSLVSNGTQMNNNEVAMVVLSAVFGREFSIPSFKIINVSEKDLEVYVGQYSAPNLPVKISISRTGNQLFAQARINVNICGGS